MKRFAVGDREKWFLLKWQSDVNVCSKLYMPGA